MENKIRVHPIYIFISIKKFLFLLIIPLIRGLIYYIVNNNIYSWVKGSWIDISIFMVIIFLAIVRWRSYNISINDDNLIISRGIFFNETVIINKNDIAYVLVNIPFYYKLIGAVRIEVLTSGTSNIPSSKNEFILTAGNFKILKQKYFSYIVTDKNPVNHISFLTTLYSVFFSLVMSDSLAGIVLISTFISTSSKILGYQLENVLYGRFEALTKKLAFGFPPAGAAIAYMLIIGWTITFIRNLIIYINFSFKRSRDSIVTSSGIINTAIKYSNLNKLSCIDIIQNIFTKVASFCSVFIYVSNDKNSQIVIIPAINKRKLECNINKMFDRNIKTLRKMDIRPGKSTFFSYIMLPIVLFLVIFMIYKKLIRSYPYWYDFLKFMLLMCFIVFFWLLLVQIINFFTCGVSFQGDSYIIKYARFFKFHTVVIPKDKLSRIVAKQTLFQRYFKKFDIYFFSYYSALGNYKLKNIDIFNLNLLVKNLNITNIEK